MSDGPPRDIGEQGRVGDAAAADQERQPDHDGFPAPRRIDHRRPSTAREGSPTYYGQPAIKEPVWIWSVPAYFYSGGAAAGAALIGAIAQLVDRDGYDDLIGRCRRIAAVGTLLGTAGLVHDLGRPARFLNMLRVFRPTSAMSVGSWTLAASTGAATAAATLPAMGAAGLADLAGLGAGTLAPALGTYTGVLISDTAVPVWQHTRRELPFLFGASAVASATHLLDLHELDERDATLSHRLGIAAKAAELAGAAAVERSARRHPHVSRPLEEGLSGGLWQGAKTATALSLLVSVLPVPSRWKTFRRVVSAVLGTLGALTSRFAIFHAGRASARDPRATFEPQRTSGRSATPIGGS